MAISQRYVEGNSVTLKELAPGSSSAIPANGQRWVVQFEGKLRSVLYVGLNCKVYLKPLKGQPGIVQGAPYNIVTVVS